MRFGYTAKGGFYIGGSVTLAINDDLSGTVDVEYDAGPDDFMFKGEIRPHQKPADKSKKELAGYKYRVHIPILSIGLADVGITMKFELAAYMVKPYLQFDHLKLSGSLEQIEDGKLPEIDVGIKFGMGAGVSISVGVGISGELHLLVATAEAGFRGDFIGSVDMMIGATVNGRFGGDRDGLEIAVDPTVTAEVNLKAALVAFANASVFGFTIIDEEWPLASFDLATFALGSWKPIDPFTYVVGGSNPGFKDGLPSFKQEMPSGLQDGAQKGGDDPEGPERERKKEESKGKVRIVLLEVKRAGAVLDAPPKNADKGLSLDDMSECDNLLDLGDALDFYRDQADNAEELVPDVRVVTTGERLAKRFADNWFAGALRNYQILTWRRAQIAHMGRDPDTGVDVVAEREWVKTVQDQRYQADLDAAIAEQTRRMDEWSQLIMGQTTQYATAEATHEAHLQQARIEYDASVATFAKEGDAAKQQYQRAATGAAKDGVHVADLGVHVETPKPPPLIAHAVPLVRPLPPPMPAPVPMPIQPSDPPPVHVPALPVVDDIGMSAASVHKSKGAPPIPEPVVKPPVAPASLPSSEAAAQAGTSRAVATGGGGGGAARGGGSAAPTPVAKPKARSSGPATIEDTSASLGAQEDVLEQRIEALGGDLSGKGKKAPAAAAARPAVADKKKDAAAPGGATSPAPADGKDANGRAPAPGGGEIVDPAVKAAVAEGKKAEDQQQAEIAKSEAAYQQTIDLEKRNATGEIARVEAARKAGSGEAHAASPGTPGAEKKKDATGEAAAPTAPTTEPAVAKDPEEGADPKKPNPDKEAPAPLGTEIVKSFEMDGESHTLTVTRTAQGISVVMASDHPGQLRTKAETTLVTAREQRETLKAQLRAPNANRGTLGVQKRDLDGLVAALDAFLKKFDAQKTSDGDKPPTAAVLEQQTFEMATELVAIGRTYRVTDLGSRQALQLPGFQHDRFIYETLVELATEVRAGHAGASASNDPLRARLARELGIGGREYRRARVDLNNLFAFHGPELFVDQRDGYVFPQEDVGVNRAVLDGKVYAWSTHETPGKLTQAKLQTNQKFRQQLHKDYGYPRTWTVNDVLEISRAVAEGKPLEKKQSALFIAAMVSEADRNIVAEVTNLLVLGGSDTSKRVFDQMPMTIGGTAPRNKDRTDPTLTGANPQLPPGTVTDHEVDLAKRSYHDKTGEELGAAVDRLGPTPTTQAHLKETLRSMFVKLEATRG